MEFRKLSRELSRLHGFPYWFTFAVVCASWLVQKCVNIKKALQS